MVAVVGVAMACLTAFFLPIHLSFRVCRTYMLLQTSSFLLFQKIGSDFALEIV